MVVFSFPFRRLSVLPFLLTPSEQREEEREREPLLLLRGRTKPAMGPATSTKPGGERRGEEEKKSVVVGGGRAVFRHTRKKEAFGEFRSLILDLAA